MSIYTPWREVKFAPKYFYVDKFGSNDAVGGTWEDVWAGGSTYTGFLTSAIAVRVAAGNAADDDEGANAQEITVEGLDQDWNLASETIATNGTGASSATTTTFIRVFRAYVSRVGGYGNTNADTVTIETTGAATVAVIPSGFGQSEQAIYAVPAGHTAFVMSLNVTVQVGGSNDPADIRLVTREAADQTSANFAPVRTRHSITSISDRATRYWEEGIKVPEKSDVWVQAEQSGVGSSPKVDAEFGIVVIPNSLYA